MSSTRSSGGSINCTVRRGRARNSRENVMDRRPVGSRRDVVTEPRSRPWNIMSRPASPIPIGVDPLSASFADGHPKTDHDPASHSRRVVKSSEKWLVEISSNKKFCLRIIE